MKKYKIVIAGSQGIVGAANYLGFRKLSHQVFAHDLVLNTKLEDFLDTDACFICVPTPLKDSRLDCSIVESVIKELNSLCYMGIVVIRSTVSPGFTDDCTMKYPRLNIVFSPEFLKERTNVADFTTNHRILAIGTDKEENYNIVKEMHGNYPKQTVQLKPIEAELLKLFHNSLAGNRIEWANEAYDICEMVGADYTDIKNALVHSTQLPDMYLDVSPQMRGFVSVCLSKDIPELITFSDTLGLDCKVLKSTWDGNEPRLKTPFGGTRENY